MERGVNPLCVNTCRVQVDARTPSASIGLVRILAFQLAIGAFSRSRDCAMCIRQKAAICERSNPRLFREKIGC